jgi:hypothetical protein
MVGHFLVFEDDGGCDRAIASGAVAPSAEGVKARAPS